MKQRNGQVALYLVLSLVVITVLAAMNVGAFLAVRARNYTMNAGDAAALAVAKYQGELLNQIGELNILHLKAAIADKISGKDGCDEIVKKQCELCFLAPMEGIRIGSEFARQNGIEDDDAMAGILRNHVVDVRNLYEKNPDSYPPPWEGAWEDYAAHLEAALAGGVAAGPDNVDFVDAAGGHILLNQSFYHAIAGRNWCWFHFNAMGVLNGYTSFTDWEPLPIADERTRQERCANCEIYSLNLVPRTGSAVDLLGTNLIMQLTGATAGQLAASATITNRNQVWYFYGSMWRKWWEIDPDGEWQFPVVGPVRPEFDVRGAAAICRVNKLIPDVLGGVGDRRSVWSAAAKPFGSVENEQGELKPVTAFRGFVTPAFFEARLVPLDTVGGKDLSTADPEWMEHVREHLPRYMKYGPPLSSECYYCQQLITWERAYIRNEGKRWLKYNSKSCIRTDGPGSQHGGSAHGH